MSLETYITLQEASQRYNLDPELLTTWLTRGRLQGGRLNGTFVLLEDDARRMAERATKKQLREKVRHLEGVPIGIREASRKYSLNSGTISRWAKLGYVRVLTSGVRGQKTLVDESDVAYANELVRMQQSGQGKEVFTAEFIPDWF